jgi:predicted ArsR family transcriptional regulator
MTGPECAADRGRFAVLLAAAAAGEDVGAYDVWLRSGGSPVRARSFLAALTAAGLVVSYRESPLPDGRPARTFLRLTPEGIAFARFRVQER